MKFPIINSAFISVIIIFCQPNLALANACDLPSKDCLNWANQQLVNKKPYSMSWYNIKLWQLDSLMTLKEFKLLQQELDALANIPNPPLMFSAYLNIYQAKLLLIGGNRVEARSLLEPAINDLTSLNKSFYSPMRMISIANLMQNLKQYEESLTLLKRVERDFEDSRDIHLKLELYGNLGHNYRLLKDYKQALMNYKMSLYFAIELRVEQQIATLHNHVGRMHLAMGKHQLAEASFINALIHSEKDERPATIINAKINLAFFYVQVMKLTKAQSVILGIRDQDVEAHQQKRWQSISKALKDNK